MNFKTIEIVTKTNKEEFKNLVEKYNSLSKELKETANKLAKLNIVETRKIRIPESEI